MSFACTLTWFSPVAGILLPSTARPDLARVAATRSRRRRRRAPGYRPSTLPPMAGAILVTGADGFVGRHLMAQLGAAAMPSSADVTDAAAIRDAVAAAAPAAVVHLAAFASVAQSW